MPGSRRAVSIGVSLVMRVPEEMSRTAKTPRPLDCVARISYNAGCGAIRVSSGLLRLRRNFVALTVAARLALHDNRFRGLRISRFYFLWPALISSLSSTDI
jgi:hypothetical protein